MLSGALAKGEDDTIGYDVVSVRRGSHQGVVVPDDAFADLNNAIADFPVEAGEVVGGEANVLPVKIKEDPVRVANKFVAVGLDRYVFGDIAQGDHLELLGRRQQAPCDPHY